jgi:spermidine/putrescine transport system ATP-binding protein
VTVALSMAEPPVNNAPARSLIEISAVEKIFAGGSIKALSDINILIKEREFFTLLGPSGCGKTTLLRMIAGFEYPTHGGIRINGLDVVDLPPRARSVNMVFQNYALFPHLTVGQNIAFGLEMLKWKRADVAARVDEVLALVRLQTFKERKPAQLSGGQQQRVALARALAPRPQVLLLDEPLSALDMKLRKEMQFELKQLQRQTGVTFILVTHDQEEALAMSDRLAVMSAGRVQQLGTPQEIYDRPANRFVADFIGEANLIPGALLGVDPATLVSVRPERITLAGAGEPARLSGVVKSATFLGADSLIELEASTTPIRARIRGVHMPAPGMQTGLYWPDEAEWVLRE